MEKGRNERLQRQIMTTMEGTVRQRQGLTRRQVLAAAAGVLPLVTGGSIRRGAGRVSGAAGEGGDSLSAGRRRRHRRPHPVPEARRHVGQ